MTPDSFPQRLAVCSWSLQPIDPHDLIVKLQATGISRLQLALDPLRESPDVWKTIASLCHDHGVEIVSGMFGCVGEDYSTLETIRITGGIVPDTTWEQNWRNIQTSVALAQELKLDLVTFHAGFLPHDPTDPAYSKLCKRLEQVAEVFAGHKIALALETGQETAVTLAALLTDFRHTNVGVNFDPANMILYDKGDPIEALRQLQPWIRQVHLKDAIRTRVAGVWGQEVRVGMGEVNWPAFFETLREMHFSENLCIEREAGNERVEDIRAARLFVEQMEG